MIAGKLTLIACGLSLAAVVAYLFWLKIRVVRLRNDIAAIYGVARNEAERDGMLEDPSFRQLELWAAILVQGADWISIPTSFVVFIEGRKSPASSLPPTVSASSADPFFEPKIQIAARVTRYLAKETLTGRFLFWALAIASLGQVFQLLKDGPLLVDAMNKFVSTLKSPAIPPGAIAKG